MMRMMFSMRHPALVAGAVALLLIIGVVATAAAASLAGQCAASCH